MEREGDHYPENVYLPIATIGVCRNVKNCKSGYYPHPITKKWGVELGDGWCMSCYDTKIAGNNPHPRTKITRASRKIASVGT